MSRYSLNPDRLFDRPWRPGHPFHPKTGRFRRLVMRLLLVLLCGVIWGYGYITDAKRVRSMAEQYLSELVNGRVTVESASLSLFEGLRLDGVRVYVDPESDDSEPPRPDALLFSARTFILQYDPRSILRGQLQAGQIIAEKPQFHLSWNADTGRWNFNRMGENTKNRPAPLPSATPSAPPPLPELMLRNARIEINELRDGKQTSLGYVSIDGQLTPRASQEGGGQDQYEFVLQSRGLSDAMGPLVTGHVRLDNGQTVAHLKQFEFGPDVRVMLPDEVGRLLERLDLSGRIDVPTLAYTPSAPGRPGKFEVEMKLDGVNFAVPADQWASAAETTRRDDTRKGAAIMRRAFAVAGLGGIARDTVNGVAMGSGTPMPVAPVKVAGLLSTGPVESGVDSATPRPRHSATPPQAQATGSGVPHPMAPPVPPVATTARNPADMLAELLEPGAVQFKSVNGTFRFTERGMEIHELTGRAEGNLLRIDGHIDGYGPDAMMSVHIASADSEDLTIPAAPRYIWSLPAAVREFYEKTRPQGTCRIGLNLERTPQSAGAVEVGGFVELLDAQFLFDEFKYPVRQTHGRIELARDPKTGLDWLMFKGIRGRGIENGPNADRTLDVDGWIGPVNVAGQEPGGLIRISAKDITREPALIAAFDDDVREALAIFDARHVGQYPLFRGDAVCEVYKDVGAIGKMKVRLDLNVKEAEGELVGFPFPVRKLAATVRIRDGYAEIEHARMQHGDGTVEANGRVVWKAGARPSPAGLSSNAAKPKPGEDARAPGPAGDGRAPDAPFRTDLKLTVRGLPIDEDLLSALPKDPADWIRRTDAHGKLDIDGRILGPDKRNQVASRKASTPADEPLDYDLTIALRDGTVRPENGKFEVAGVSGNMHLTPGRLDVLKLGGVRGDARLSAVGQITWAGDRTSTVLSASAEKLALDAALHDLLPHSAQSAWDEVRPKGTLDAEITYAGEVGGASANAAAAAAPGSNVAVIDLARSPSAQTTQPSALMLELPAHGDRPAIFREVPSGLRGSLRPRDLSVSLQSVPFALDKLGGEVAISPDRVDLKNLTARHGMAELAISGVGTLVPLPQWDLRINAKNVPIDDDLRKGLPSSLSAMLDSVKAKGTLGVELEKFVYRGGVDARRQGDKETGRQGDSTAAASLPATSQSTNLVVSLSPSLPLSPSPELDIAGRLNLTDVSLDAGVQLDKVNGSIGMAVAVRNDRLHSLAAKIDVASMEMAGREVTGFKADALKRPDQPELALSKMQAVVAGGDLAGDAIIQYPDDSPARYALSLFLRNADIRELGKESAENLSGRVTASLGLEGSWGKNPIRRGRGDVVVSGKEMYRIPLMLGMMQVTNLSLPISSPFSSGTARYSVDGQKVTFERIELRSNNMLMSGDGSLDFDSKKVSMTFVTDNPGAFKIPFLNDLWRGAQQELLRIHVRGTVQDPKVENRPLGTFTTTVDEVFKGDTPKTKPKK